LPLNVKLGLASRAQLSLSFAPVRTADSRGFATDSVTAAIKWRLADDQPVVGTVALLPAIELPTTLGGQDTSGAAGLVFITSRSVHSVDLDLNLGYTRRVGRASDSWTSQTLWAASGSGPLLPTVTWGAEMFGYVEGYEEGPRAHPVGALASATVAVRPWFTIDVSGTVAVSGAVPRAVQVGAVWNVGRLWRAHARGAPAVGPTTWTRSERR